MAALLMSFGTVCSEHRRKFDLEGTRSDILTAGCDADSARAVNYRACSFYGTVEGVAISQHIQNGKMVGDRCFDGIE